MVVPIIAAVEPLVTDTATVRRQPVSNLLSRSSRHSVSGVRQVTSNDRAVVDAAENAPFAACCVQVFTNDYQMRMKALCKTLERMFENETLGVMT